MNRLALLTGAVLLASSSGSAAAATVPDTNLINRHLLDVPSGSSVSTSPLRSLRRIRHRRLEAPKQSVARQQPMAEPFSNIAGVQLYAWREGAIYTLLTAPDEVSDIALQPGEALVSVAAGDTARWIISDTNSGSGATLRPHVLVKPASSGLRTNLLIATDRRVYRVELASSSRGGASSIAWTYPDETLLALKSAVPATSEPAVASGVRVEALNFDYRIEGDSPPWRPVRAFDDGRQVFVEFPLSIAQGEVPPLFVIGDEGKAELVNYRQRGRYYVIDRLFGTAELRLGEKHQLVVRIVSERSKAPRRPS